MFNTAPLRTFKTLKYKLPGFLQGRGGILEVTNSFISIYGQIRRAEDPNGKNTCQEG